ncbi:hypothetical protein MANES_16G057725v8 [Manihot esculenta]|uniref:Uncharacterized protein n=1 Tax=Manihot esculenta TaxID=3983 RepID=A0ACB7G672_MANES|nr:hypothetical protein MANES_16G057725v8 [Manihot esculenta]
MEKLWEINYNQVKEKERIIFTSQLKQIVFNREIREVSAFWDASVPCFGMHDLDHRTQESKANLVSMLDTLLEIFISLN